MNNVSIMLTTGAALFVTGLSTAGFTIDASAASNGQAIFEKNCSVCHSIAPPPKSAPPILPIAGRYRQHFASRSEGINYMANFIQAPSKERVVVDPEAVTRFGLMPPIPLSKADAIAVATWVWDQNSGSSRGKGMGSGRGAGQGDCNQR